MFVRCRLVAALAAACVAGSLACRGSNYLVVRRDGGAGSAVSAVWVDSEEEEEELDAAVGGSAGTAGMPGGSSGLADAAAVPAIPCASDGECLDADPCNGIESCDNGSCLRGMPVLCSDGNQCTRDACDSSTGLCMFASLANGVPCGAVDKCDGQVCLEGFCTPGPPPVCADDGNACTVRACDPSTGACIETRLPEGSPCDDASVCNGRETCQQGMCRPGTPPVCGDTSSCTVDRCDPVLGCVNAPVGDGTSCGDANLCNGSETCAGGVCRPSNALTCEDFNPCTTDSCDPVTGACRFVPLANGASCPDGNLCDGQKCQDGQCVAGPAVVCARDNDNNPCTATACNAATGICSGSPVANGTPCPDGDQCDGTETCVNGSCAGSGVPLTCADDGNPCTTELCAPAAGCLHLNVTDGTSCADADGCDGTETCTAGRCSSTGTPVNCFDSNPCTSDLCVSVPNPNPTLPPTGVCSPVNLDGLSCGDNNACNGVEVCGGGVCLAGTPLGCDDHNPCTTDSCSPVSGGGCVFTPVSNGTVCGSSDPCSGIVACNQGVCQVGPPVSCTAPAVCVPGVGTCQ